MGYLPRVLFFNAFELGAESCESSILERSIKINSQKSFQQWIELCPNEFLKILYDHTLVHYFHQKDFQDKSNWNSFPKHHEFLQVYKVLVL